MSLRGSGSRGKTGLRAVLWILVASTLLAGGPAGGPEGGPATAGEIGAGNGVAELLEARAKSAEPAPGVGGPQAAEESDLLPDSPERPWLEIPGEESRPPPSEAEAGPRILTHVVQRGETLSDIARQYGVSLEYLVASNDISDIHNIQAGQELRVLSPPGIVHTVARGETLWKIARVYRVPVAEIEAVNGIDRSSLLRPGQLLMLPGARVPPALQRRVDAARGGTGFLWPAEGGWISSRFGPRWGRIHEGIDIAVPPGSVVRAAAQGRVKIARWYGGYGLLVVLDHGDGVSTRYGHNSRLLVREGEWVRRGEAIALSGNTGNSTGPHLHFEIRMDGRPVDPLRYLRP